MLRTAQKIKFSISKCDQIRCDQSFVALCNTSHTCNNLLLHFVIPVTFCKNFLLHFLITVTFCDNSSLHFVIITERTGMQGFRSRTQDLGPWIRDARQDRKAIFNSLLAVSLNIYSRMNSYTGIFNCFSTIVDHLFYNTFQWFILLLMFVVKDVVVTSCKI